MASARIRLACLWLSQVARVLADWCLRMFVILEIVRQATEARGSAWHLVTAIYIAPFVLLSPFNGALSNALPKRWVLVGASGFCLLVTVVFALILGPGGASVLWLTCLGLMAMSSAVYSPTRYALLPAAACDTHIPLTRVNGIIEMGGSVAIVVGMILGVQLAQLHEEATAQSAFPSVLVVTAVLNLISIISAAPVRFRSDIWRPEAPVEAIRGFFRDTGRIVRDRVARYALFSLAGVLGLITAGSGAAVAHLFGDDPSAALSPLRDALIYVSVGAALGCGIAGIQGHPRRSLGFIPLAITGLLLVLAYAASQPHLNLFACFLLGVMGGLANVPLRAAYQAAVPTDARGNGMAVMNFAIFVCTILLATLLFVLVSTSVLSTPMQQFAFLALLSTIAALFAWWALHREWLELTVEVLLWPVYRIKAHGAGLDDFPPRGPLIVIANHTAWFDPLWLIKVLPRRLLPMMTSVFYDIPVLRWVAKHFGGAIRVPATGFRREAPELDEAVELLDSGGCVLIFPEGWARRNEEQLLRYFGQGIWHILHERPLTPVVACWIEGGWGSWTSHKDGPPLKNKRIDWWRRIDVGVLPPEVLDTECLADQKATRLYLMELCLQARVLLGLPTPVEIIQQRTVPALSDDEIG